MMLKPLLQTVNMMMIFIGGIKSQLTLNYLIYEFSCQNILTKKSRKLYIYHNRAIASPLFLLH
jgi:hypothetical protein